MNRTSAAAIALALSATALGVSTVNPSHKFSWGENIGWMNWRDAGAGAQGAAMSALSTYLSGYVWSENVGWINLGDGSPVNGTAYANTTGADAGVNIMPNGDLWGLAWGENIGWISFDTAPTLAASGKQARYDSAAKRLRGYAWGENVGWINLEDPTNYVAISPPCYGDLNADGVVNTADLTLLLVQFGNSVAPGTPADINADGVVNTQDLTLLLVNFGRSC